MTTFRLTAEQRRYFYELVAAGNITRAAQSLYLSRQGLSRSMRGLEESIGVALFARGKQGVQLTRAGRALLHHLREEDRAWEGCLDRLRSLGNSEPEPVRVGLLSMFVGYEQKRQLLSCFQEDDELRVEIVDGDHDVFWQAMLSGSLECAITIAPPDHVGLPSIKLADDTLSVLLSNDDPLARKASVDFARDLCGRTVVQTSPYKGRLYETVFRNHGILTDAILHDRNLMLAHVSTRKQCFIIQTEYALNLVTDEVCRRPLVNAPLDMASVFVFRPDLSPRAKRVAREIVGNFGKTAELDAYFASQKAWSPDGNASQAEGVRRNLARQATARTASPYSL